MLTQADPSYEWNFVMPENLKFLNWIAVGWITLSAFHGFTLAFGATTLIGDVICSGATFLVIMMVITSKHIVSSSNYFLKAICGISLFLGSCAAFVGVYTFFSEANKSGEYLEHRFWATLGTALLTGKGLIFAFITLVFIYFSTHPLSIPKNLLKEHSNRHVWYRKKRSRKNENKVKPGLPPSA